MTTVRPFVRGIARSFAPLGGNARPATRTHVDLRVDGAERDLQALRGDALQVGRDLERALIAEEAVVRK